MKADSELTEQGKQEARYANAAWKTQIEKGAPLPQSYYSSPLQRSANTLSITWCDITLDKPNPPRPLIKEVRLSRLVCVSGLIWG